MVVAAKCDDEYRIKLYRYDRKVISRCIYCRLQSADMEQVGEYEFNKASLIGHGAFAMVFKGHHKEASYAVLHSLIFKLILHTSSLKTF